LIVVTIPACNESENLKPCVEALLQKGSELNEDFCIVIAEDGSTDGTDIVAKNLEHMYPGCQFSFISKTGKGTSTQTCMDKNGRRHIRIYRL